MFHGQDVPYNMHCNATAVLKIDFVYKQGKDYDLQVYVEECTYTDGENQQCSMLSDDDNDDSFFKTQQKKAKKFFVTYLGLQN